MNYKALDEALNFLNTGKITLSHTKNLISTYGKISHKPLKNDETGFYLFHNEIKKKMDSILKPFNLKCKLFGVYENNNLLIPERICTVVIEKGKLSDDDYGIQVAKLMNDYKGDLLVSSLNKLTGKVKVTNVDYCYTVAYKIYSIDVTYMKE